VGGKNKNLAENVERSVDATSRCEFSWILFVGTKMLGFTEKEVGHMTLKKWSLLYRHFRAYHNFCVQQQLFKDERSHSSDNDEWLPN
jgi:hypothetical protein